MDGKVTEDNLPKEVVVNDTTITFKYGEPIQLHVVVDVKNEMSLHYVFEDNVHSEVIETRHVEENGVLNRTFTNGAYSHVNFFNENGGTGKNTYLDEGHSSHDSMFQLGYSELSDASIEASYTFELDGEGADVRLRMAALSKNKEKKHLKIHIYEWDIDVYVPENEEQRYIKAAENVSQKIEAYMDIYVRQQYVPQKSYMEILLMTLLDIAVTSTEKERVLGFNNFWRRINNIIKNK